MNKVFTVRRFPSATGHVWYQVMGPFGRVSEYLDYEEARADANRRETQHA